MTPSSGAASNWAETHGRLGSDRRASLAGMLILLVSTGIIFAALVIAFVARRLMGDDWIATPKPPILWINTGILILSSVALDMARRALKAHRRIEFNRWWSAATGLGVLFLVGQGMAWGQLRAAGFYVATNPSSSFLYVLTAVHALHVIGGLTALVWVEVQALRLRLGPAKRTAIDVSAIFWHFLDALWILLMIIFYAWA
jgi:cytochrome c oxidase subunit 3